jgi:hypothetical protein
MYIECMMKPLKHADQLQAQQAWDQGTFVYHNPCSKCAKECSTPTKDIWVRRVREFGNIANMYANYVCRNCRKHVAAKDVVAKAPEPLPTCIAKEPASSITKQAPMMKKKAERPLVQIKPEQQSNKPHLVPGEHVEHKPGHFAFSVWENGIHQGTTWYKYSDKSVD